MPRIFRALSAVAFSTALAVAAVALPANSAPPSQGSKVTQQSCQAQGGTFTSSKGTKTCTVTSSTSTSDPTPVLGSTQLDPNGTYYTGTFHKETTTTTTTTTTQRGNEAPTTSSSTTSTDRYVADQCYRVDNYGQANETVTQVDNSQCNSRINQFAYL